MKLKAEISDGFLISTPDGKAKAARVAVIEFQKQAGGKWDKANVIVESEDVPTVLEAAAAYMRSKTGAVRAA